MKPTSKNRGQLLVETMLVLPLMLLLSGLGLDLIRRVEHQLILHHITCLVVRERALGLASQTSDELVRHHVKRFWGEAIERPGQELRIEEVFGAGKWEVGAHLRYPAFFRFPWRGKTKHHMEVSERCSFPIG